MSEGKYIDVFTFEGEYEEDSEAKIYNILDKKLCLKHDWTNASLHWVKNGYYIEWKPQPVNDKSTKWGFYGEFRICKKCKEIDCIHYYDEEKLLRRWDNSKDYAVAVIKHCKRCNTWIYTNGWGVVNSYSIEETNIY
jgi:hypothetical protein